MIAGLAIAAQPILQIPKDAPPLKDYSSAEEVVWDGKEGKYTLYLDSIFAATENKVKFWHAVVRSEGTWGSQTGANLIDCKKKTWRTVWYTQTGTRDLTYVGRRDYTQRRGSPAKDSPMGAVIERVCRKP